jgi:hypothetical protein
MNCCSGIYNSLDACVSSEVDYYEYAVFPFFFPCPPSVFPPLLVEHNIDLSTPRLQRSQAALRGASISSFPDFSPFLTHPAFTARLLVPSVSSSHSPASCP